MNRLLCVILFVCQSHTISAMSIYDRSTLPSRPVPSLSSQQNKIGAAAAAINNDENTSKKILDAARLIGMTRVGSAVVSPNGQTAVFHTSDYDFTNKKSNQQLWLADLQLASTLDDTAIRRHDHLRKLTEGKQYDWASVSSPQYSPCGGYLAFLSNRKDKDKSSVWVLPLDGPGEARLLAEFPISVGDLHWTAHGGIAVSASVYVDQQSVDDGGNGKDAMTATADRDKALADDDAVLGGLDAVLYHKLPIREWDRWLDAKMAHPFYVPVTDAAVTLYNATNAKDLLAGIPTAVPSGAFGGSEDWSISSQGHMAFSARPPLASDEAWTTNRNIYLKTNHLRQDGKDQNNAEDDPLGTCLTLDNPGFDTNPTFSPDGKYLTWLTMAGPAYEADAIGIQLYELETGVTSTLLKAEEDWEYSPHSLTWSKDGQRLYFTTDMRSRGALCSMDVATGAKGGITIHSSESSLSLHGEIETNDDGERSFLTTVQSLTMPSELFLTTTTTKDTKDKGATQRQLTHFNTDTISETSLGRPGEIIYKGAKDEDVQAWLVRPAGLSIEEEERINSGGKPTKKYPVAVLYHGGPQGSTGDDFHYRWNLQYYASMGFAVLAPNFHGSTGFGHQFCRDISGNWEVGGIDTIAGVRAALKKYPWLDPERVVGLGASYGGYTSNWLNGNAPKGMFKALVCHCGTFDLKSSYYATEGKLYFLNPCQKLIYFIFITVLLTETSFLQSSFSWKPSLVDPLTQIVPYRKIAPIKRTIHRPRCTNGKHPLS